jgi:hypothetical protein
MAHEFIRIDLEEYKTSFGDDKVKSDAYETLMSEVHGSERHLNALAAYYLNKLIDDACIGDASRNEYARHPVEDAYAHTLFSVANGQFGRGVVPPFEEISAYRKALGQAKIPAAVSFIDSFMTTYPKRKLVVFTSHKDVVKTLHADPSFNRYNPTTLTGDDTATQKTDNVKKFQEDKSCRLIFCNSAAANMGVTLTAASDILHVEMDWSGFRLAQSNARIDRRGQTRACRAYYLIAGDSLDLHMTKVVHKKSISAAKVLGDVQSGNLTGVKIEHTGAASDDLSLQLLADTVHEDDPTPDLTTFWRKVPAKKAS